MIFLSGLFFLLFIHGLSCYLCVVSLLGVSFSLQSSSLLSIFLDVSMSQAILPIRRPLNWGTIVFWSPVSIGAGVELVVLEIRNNKIKSDQSADREAWEDVIRIEDACFQKFVYLILCLVFLSYTKLRFYLNENENETWEKCNHWLFGSE